MWRCVEWRYVEVCRKDGVQSGVYAVECGV